MNAAVAKISFTVCLVCAPPMSKTPVLQTRDGQFNDSKVPSELKAVSLTWLEEALTEEVT